MNTTKLSTIISRLERVNSTYSLRTSAPRKRDEEEAILDWAMEEEFRERSEKELFEAAKEGADPNTQNEDGETPLHEASYRGHTDIVKELLKHKADPNIQGTWGDTPLYSASYGGHTDIVKTLLAAGADPNIQNNYGRTPLDSAKAPAVKKLLKEWM